jgi:succinylarginine dihydrolase
MEFNFDGLVGPTHNYGGLSRGNVPSVLHKGKVSNPRAAALEGLRKMRFVASLGVGQAVLPPHPRPSISALRTLGFTGTDEEVLSTAAGEEEHLLRLCSSAAAMWTANAATVAPSADTEDGCVHVVPANLQAMFHRSIEAPTTTTILRAIFADKARFVVHDALPGGGQFADEGAANHTRLVGTHGVAHLFAWGRRAYGATQWPTKNPARQTLEASRALARLHQLFSESTLFPQQHPAGIDAGAFHTDVLAVGHETFMMVHEFAFVDWPVWERRLREWLGEELTVERVSNHDLPVDDAVRAYPFNSQLVTLPSGGMVIVAPSEAQDNLRARNFLKRVVEGENPVQEVHYLDVRESMDNGGGPACLRLRVELTEPEVKAILARVFVDEALFSELEKWVEKHYRDRLLPKDLSDPRLWREGLTALDELTGILRLGSVYDFQQLPL